MQDYFEYQNASITVCNQNADVIYQNANSRKIFGDVISKSLFECHPKHACDKIKKMLIDGVPNSYTISKNGVKKLIYQTPWRDSEDKISGLIEYSFVIDEVMPHFVRS
ncbi:MAG: PAS sensor protein [Prevotellaceae bacterium]|jgi:hypothetical protein|nr:PAS sensor protein [Prevotellaceae bacterium]